MFYEVDCCKHVARAQTPKYLGHTTSSLCCQWWRGKGIGGLTSLSAWIKATSADGVTPLSIPEIEDHCMAGFHLLGGAGGKLPPQKMWLYYSMNIKVTAYTTPPSNVTKSFL